MKYRVTVMFPDLEVVYDEEDIPNQPCSIAKSIEADNPDDATLKAQESLIRCAKGETSLENFEIISVRSID